MKETDSVSEAFLQVEACHKIGVKALWQEDLWSPMAACDFAATFGAITVRQRLHVMPRSHRVIEL